MISAKAIQDVDPKLFGIRTFVLVTLCAQNAGHALLARYSQGVLRESYSSTEVVLVAEMIKLAFSAYFTLIDRSESDAVGMGFSKLLWLLSHARKIIILVILYSFANILSYYALARVDASVYTVLLQLKIFTTAAFAVVFLGRNITSAKWRALILLVLGCILVASPTFNRPIDCDAATEVPKRLARMLMGKKAKAAAAEPEEDEHVSALDSIMGVGSVLIMVTISGCSAIYFESMLKKVGEKITIWERNFQLAFYSIMLLLGVVVYESTQNTIANNGAFQPWFKGWTINAVLVSIIQAAGGLLVAATLKYADAILKTLATCGSIVLSSVLGWMLLGGQLDIFVAIGAVATILAIFNYTLDGL